MVTTDCDIFNTLMDKILSPKDRRLMIVSPEGATHAIGIISTNPEAISLMKRCRQLAVNQVEAYDKLIMLSELGMRLGVDVKEVENP